jgi:Mrp family chromosome partitioning ATPase
MEIFDSKFGLKKATSPAIYLHDGATSPAESHSLAPSKSEGAPELPEDPPTPSSRSLGQAFMAEPLEPSRAATSVNGFRHVRCLKTEESRLVFQTDPKGMAAEQFRLLRRTVMEEFDGGAVLLITSPAKGDGKTLTAFNLCTCLGNAGDPTLLVEADFRQPKVRELVGCGIDAPALEDALAGGVEPAQAVRWIGELNFHAAMVAKTPDHPSLLTNGVGVKRFLTWARSHFFWVVLDAAPVLPVADVPELLEFANAALLVIRAQITPRELSKRAIEILGKSLRGVIFNDVTAVSNPHFRHLSDYTNGTALRSRSEIGSKEK